MRSAICARGLRKRRQFGFEILRRRVARFDGFVKETPVANKLLTQMSIFGPVHGVASGRQIAAWVVDA